eukprot:1138135-Pelagomonas_calceolata.AAC.1
MPFLYICMLPFLCTPTFTPQLSCLLLVPLACPGAPCAGAAPDLPVYGTAVPLGQLVGQDCKPPALIGLGAGGAHPCSTQAELQLLNVSEELGRSLAQGGETRCCLITGFQALLKRAHGLVRAMLQQSSVT